CGVWPGGRISPRTGLVELRRAPGRVAGEESPGAVGDRAEEGHLRSQGDPRVREAGRRSEPSRLSVRADRLRRARHQSEALEQLEVLAVRRLLSAHARGAAPRTGESDRPGSADLRNAVARKGADHSRRPGGTGSASDLAALHRCVFPAAHTRGNRVAYVDARTARWRG